MMRVVEYITVVDEDRKELYSFIKEYDSDGFFPFATIGIPHDANVTIKKLITQEQAKEMDPLAGTRMVK